MQTDEIRSKFLEFFKERDHMRLASGSLVPAQHDPSVLLTTAGMHPLKPYFQGREQPPHHRLTTCQKCFRTPDIDEVGVTKRHLTFFEMLGNFSMGDYFKQGAVEFAWELSLQGFGFEPEKIWITVHEGDDSLGLGPDEEAIEAWLSVGVPQERIVRLSSKDNFWQAGPIGPCGPCSELYLDRGLEFGGPDDLPGDDTERFLEYWNLVFMQFEQDPVGTLTPLPKQNIDTGLGLNRMAALLQGTDSVFETDQFLPLIQLGEELSGKRYSGAFEGEGFETDRALRILADHTRGMSFLIADGVTPSNEGRGYVLRKVMRRAIHQGRSAGIEGDFLGRFGERVRELMGSEYPELHEQREAIEMWMATEEESFGRTIERGLKMLGEMVERAREEGHEGIGAENAFRLHDTYGFPIELTTEIAAQRGLGVDQQGFEDLMEQQRRGSQATAGRGAKDVLRERAATLSGHSEFVGYETLTQETEVVSVERLNGSVLVKLEESPFYAEGGGQVSDTGEVDGLPVGGVLRMGDDQVLVLDAELQPGTRVTARVDPAHRRPTECNHTATHLLHAALRERLGGHVRQAGSYVGPDKLRFDFTHGAPLEHADVMWIEDRVNAEILANRPVRAITTTLEEAKALGAMALFGEKYGDVVRMVEIGDGNWSRELCGGTHVRATAEIGTLRILSESSSAANVRRIEAVTGPVAVELLRRHDSLIRTAAGILRAQPEDVPDRLMDLRSRVKELEKQLKEGAPAAASVDPGAATDVAGVKVLVSTAEGADPKGLPDLADRLKGQLGGEAVVVLGVPTDGKVSLIVSVTPAAVERGVKAGDIVKLAAGIVGGGGGGRPTMAQAGGRDPEKLPEALEAARAEIARILG